MPSISIGGSEFTSRITLSAISSQVLLLPTEVDGTSFPSSRMADTSITAVSMGNPHAVQVVADVDRAPVAQDGPQIEAHARFPQRVNAGFMQVLSRTALAEQVWDMNFDSDTNVIEVAVRRLRVKVDDPFEPKLIRTVRGMGYVLEAMEPS